MTIPFNNIPAGNGIRVPLFYAEMDSSMAAPYTAQSLRSLLIGVANPTAPMSGVLTPQLLTSQSQVNSMYGRGSVIARMYAMFRLVNPVGEVWGVGVAQASTGAAATGTIVVTATPTAAFALSLYIAGQLVSVPVALTDTATTIATNIAAAVNALLDLPVTATSTTGTVTLTALWKGTIGNDITLVDTFRGAAGGEQNPTNYGVALNYNGNTGKLSAGTGATSLTSLSFMGDDPYDFVMHPFSDATTLALFATEYGDSAGRWSYSRQIYGHCYTAQRGTSAALVTAFGAGAVNDPHHTVAAVDVDCPNPIWEYAASYGGRNAVFITADPARPTQTGQLTGLLASRAGKKFLYSERNTLLNNGVATSAVVAGQLQIERAITTYQLNKFGQADVAYLDSETLHTAAYVLRYLAAAITSKYPRHKLANDGTRFSAGSAIVTPAVIRGELIAAYDQLVLAGIVENRDIFITYLIVERDATNVNRLNVLFPPDYVNQLRVFAVLNQFRLQY